MMIPAGSEICEEETAVSFMTSLDRFYIVVTFHQAKRGAQATRTVRRVRPQNLNKHFVLCVRLRIAAAMPDWRMSLK